MVFIRKNNKNISDESLMKGICQGNEVAFEILYNRYKDRLLYFFYKMLGNDNALAQDFLQDLFYKVLDQGCSFKDHKKFSTWIFSIANNMCKNEYRRRTVRNEARLPLGEQLYSIKENIIELPVESIILKALDRLDKESQSIFILKYREEFSIEEIATVTNLPSGTIKSRLFYTRKKLQEIIIQNHPELIEEYNL